MKTEPPSVGIDHPLEVIERAVVLAELHVDGREREIRETGSDRVRCICSSRSRQYPSAPRRRYAIEQPGAIQLEPAVWPA